MQTNSDGLIFKSQKERLDLLNIIKCVKMPLKNIIDQQKISDFCQKFFTNSVKVDNLSCKPSKYLMYNFNDVLQNVVHRINVIKYHTYNFIRMFILYEYDKFNKITTIDERYILLVMKIVSIRNNKGGAKIKNTDLHDTLVDFFNNEYSKTIDVSNLVNDDNLSFILHFEALEILKNIETNIGEHFVDNFNKLINMYFKIKDKIKKYKTGIQDVDKSIEQELFTELRSIKQDIKLKKHNGELKAPHHKRFILNVQKFGLPNKQFNKSLEYDVKCNPLEYLQCYIWINNQIEKINNEQISFKLVNNVFVSINEMPQEKKLFNVTPLSLSFIPTNITLDTSSLVSLFIEKGNAQVNANINKFKHEIWNLFFKLNTSLFKKSGYKFNYFIKTDGISCSLVFVKNGYYKEDEFKKPNKGQVKKMEKIREEIEYAYIENNLEKVKENYACNDPNFEKMVNAINNEGKRVRCTRASRNKDIKKRKYAKIREKQKTVEIKETEKKLSEYNFKTANYEKFKEAIKMKNSKEKEMRDEYNKDIYRKLRLNTYINTQKSERKMLEDIKEKIGKPKDTTIIYGDYSGTHMKGKEPLISKRIKKLLRDEGYEVYLIDEFRTSKMCNRCENELIHIKKEVKKNGEIKEAELWGLLRCSNLQCKVRTKKGELKSTILNRDDNAALNMLKITKSLLAGLGRPIKYCRECKK